jgi:hypothetical protein
MNETTISLTCQRYDEFFATLRNLHSETTQSGDQFAEILLLDLLADAQAMKFRLDRLANAAKAQATKGDKS